MDNMLAMHHPLIFAPRPSSSSSHSQSGSSSQPRSGHVIKRPKMAKKANSSTTTKQRSVQASLEAKVEKSRGWNAFFVPLARGMPGAPPSSPVMAAQGQTHMGGQGGMGMEGMEGGRGQVQHVEHVEHAHAQSIQSIQSDMFGQHHFSHQHPSAQHPSSAQHPHPLLHHTSAPASPTSTTGARTDPDSALSRETTRSFASVEEYKEWEKWAREQWVEHAIPTLELPGSLAMGVSRSQGRGVGVAEGEGGDFEMGQ